MSTTVQQLPTSQRPPLAGAHFVGEAAEGSRRGQGWLIALGASAILWTGIIVAIVGIAGLAQ